MIIIGDPDIEYENIVKISHVDDIKKSSPSSIVLFDFDMKILKYTYQNEIYSAVISHSIKEALYANSLGARYIIPPLDKLYQVQKIADHYMFDSRVLATIESSEEIEKMAIDEIDGVIYKGLL